MTHESDKVLLRRYHEQGDLAARKQLIEQYMFAQPRRSAPS